MIWVLAILVLALAVGSGLYAHTQRAPVFFCKCGEKMKVQVNNADPAGANPLGIQVSVAHLFCGECKEWTTRTLI
jgi:hypothetical protein